MRGDWARLFQDEPGTITGDFGRWRSGAEHSVVAVNWQDR